MTDATPDPADELDDVVARTRVPWATWTIIAVNVAVYLVMVARGENGITTDAHRLVAAGGNFGPLVARGQWWRIVTAAFLHGGLLHIALNMVALWSGGILLERAVGTPRFVAIYFASAVGAGLVSLLVGPAVVSVGASGAIFGVYGSLLGLALQHTRHRLDTETTALMPPHIARRLAGEIAGLFIFNLLIGLIVPGIDVAAHVGGFVAGIGLAWIGAGAAWAAGAAALLVAASAVFPLLPVTAQLALFDAACRARAGAACLGAGHLIDRTPDGTNTKAARAYFDRGCAAGSTDACLALAQIEIARGATASRVAIQAFTRACAGGEPRGCNALAELYVTGRGIPRDDRRAAELFARACDAGAAFGCFRLGAMYLSGRGVPADVRRGVMLQSKACDAGEARSCTLAAAALVSGTGVEKNAKRGMELYQKGCDGNDPLACMQLAAMVEQGAGGRQDVPRTALLLERACTLGQGPACAGAGAIIDRAINDPKRAALAYERGCALGDAASCYEIGSIYLEGRGRTRDVARAATFYEQACRRGMKQVCDLVEQLRAQSR